MSEQHEPQFGLGKSIVFSLVLIVLFLGGAELVLRTWAYFFREQVQTYDSKAGTFVLVPGEHNTPLGRVRINPQGFVGNPLAAEGPDLWRIVSVGDSCTFGAGNEVDTYPVMLDRLLAKDAAPGERIEVVNAGVSGLNSELALRRLESRVPALHPNVVTIYLGWNDLMKFDPVAQGKESAWSGVARAVDDLWLTKSMRKLLFYYLRPRMREPATGPESRTGRFTDFHPTIFENNLRTIIASVRAMNAQPVLMTLPTVLRPDMTLKDLHDAGVVFPYFPSAYAVGDLLDLLAGYNRTIRRVAEEEKVPLVDLAKSFDALPDPRPYFFDTMHTNPEGMALIAQDVAKVLERQGLVGPPSEANTAAAGGTP
jgi:lysophospholipase L1-like esterase